MTTIDTRVADQLDRAWDNLAATDQPSPSPDHADLVATVHKLHALDAAPAPDPAFVSRLGAELAQRQAGAPAPQPLRLLRLTRSRLVGLAAAAAVVIATGGVWLSSQSQPASAAAIIERAQNALESLTSAGVQTSVQRMLTTRKLITAPGAAPIGEMRGEHTEWYSAPSKRRSEGTMTMVGPDGRVMSHVNTILVNDGKRSRFYDSSSNTLMEMPEDVQLFSLGSATMPGLFGLDANVDLKGVLKQASECYTPKLIGEQVVAGRPGYVIDLGRSRCLVVVTPGSSSDFTEVAGPGIAASPMFSISTGLAGSSPPATNSAQVAATPLQHPDDTRLEIVIDKEHFAVLRLTEFSVTSGSVVATHVVTSLTYNAPIDPARFTLTPPPGSKVQSGVWYTPPMLSTPTPVKR